MIQSAYFQSLRKVKKLLGSSVLLAIVSCVLFSAQPVSAAFNPSNMMDDGVFDNYLSMNAGQINSFLNSFAYSCISPASGFEARVPTGYSPSGSYTFGGFMSAGDIIETAAKAYEINPRVLLVTLEKEQSLVTGRNSSSYCAPSASGNHKYAAAMGYGCPDSGGTYSYSGISLYRRSGIEQTEITSTCVNAANKAGFSQQVIRGAWLLKFAQQRSKGNTAFNIQKPGWDNSDDPLTCYGGPMTPGFRKRCASESTTTYYDGFTTIDGTATKVETGPTAALYWYTPHFHGNQNFVTLYESWFGPTFGPDYAWSIESFSYSGGDNSVVAGETETLTLRARNTGRHPWYNHGANPVRLATWQPGRTSPIASGSWPSGVRPANLAESMVAYNEVGTFTFTITPGTQGTFIEGLNLVVENHVWMPWPGLSPTINVVGPYSWSIESVTYGNGTGLMQPGTRQLITVRARNTGSVTWNKLGPSPVRIGTWEPQRASNLFDFTWMNPYRTTEMNENTVAPGQIAGFQFYVTVPSFGNFYERFNLVAEGQRWFNDAGLTLYMRGGEYKWEPVWHTLSTPSANIPRNTNFSVTFKAKNTGELPWNRTTGFPIRLATSSPQDRGSGIYYENWKSPVRPAYLTEETVPVGGVGTFTFDARTPNVIGERYEGFSLVAEGIAWLNDPGYKIYINVTP